MQTQLTESDYLIRIAMFYRLGGYEIADQYWDEYVNWASIG